MANDRSILERQLERVELRPFTLEGFHRRRRRKQRNRRIRAGVVALVVAAAGAAGFIRAFSSGSVPADRPTPVAPTGPGALAYGVDGDIYMADPDGSNAVRIADGVPVDGADECAPGEERAEYLVLRTA